MIGVWLNSTQVGRVIFITSNIVLCFRFAFRKLEHNVSGIGDARIVETLNYKQAVQRVLPIPC